MASTSTNGSEAILAVKVESLRKNYGEIHAVNGISFEVPRGEVFALLGPNGAGKSTLIKMLCTLAKPSSGTALVSGMDVTKFPNAVRRHIGLVFQEQTLDQQLTAEENLKFHAVLYHVPKDQLNARIDRVLALVDLSDRKKDLVSTFSGGMARRLEIARALLHTPTILFLDEPTVGLDPQTRALMWRDVMQLRREEHVTVILTTHYMDEAEYAERIAIVDHGNLITLDSPDRLKALVGTDSVTINTTDDTKALGELSSAGFAAKSTEKGLVISVSNGATAVSEIIAALSVGVNQVIIHKPTLDDVFMHFTGSEIRDQQGPSGEMSRMFAHMRGARR